MCHDNARATGGVQRWLRNLSAALDFLFPHDITLLFLVSLGVYSLSVCRAPVYQEGTWYWVCFYLYTSRDAFNFDMTARQL
jgi:hypothetical protein